MTDYFKGEWNSRKPNRKHLNEFLSLGSPICVYDLGASGGSPPPFCWLLDGITLGNFEPDARAAVEKSSHNCSIAIGPEEMDTLYLNRRQTTSSLLPPFKDVVDRYDFTKLFPKEPQIFETVSTVKIKTLGLDDVKTEFSLPDPDFLKIDVQGLTFEVLLTAEQLLSESILGIQTEVEFIETYKNQKTFGAVHEYLGHQNFEIFRLTNLNSWTYKTSIPLKIQTGQNVFCDLLYLRSLSHVDSCPEFWTPEKIIQFIKICLLYDLTDSAAAFLEKFVKKKLIDAHINRQLAQLIMKWEGALEYFYLPLSRKELITKRFLSVSNTIAKLLLPKKKHSQLKRIYSEKFENRTRKRLRNN